MITIKSLPTFLDLIDPNNPNKLYLPSDLELNLETKDSADIAGMYLAIKSGNCPDNLTLNLSGYVLTDAGMDQLVLALIHENCPQNLSVKLNNTKISKTHFDKLITALKSGKCHKGLRLDFTCCVLADEGAIQITDALSSGNLPEDLELNLSCNNISDVGAIALATALESGKCPKRLRLIFKESYGSLYKNYITNDVGIARFAEALRSGKSPEGLQLDFCCMLGNIGAFHFITALKSGNCPTNLRLNLSDNYFMDENGENDETVALRFAEALESGNCPSRLQLLLNNTSISIAGIARLWLALTKNKYPEGLVLDIAGNEDSHYGAAIDPILKLHNEIKNGKRLPDITINLGKRVSPDMEMLKAALTSATYPEGLTYKWLDPGDLQTTVFGILAMALKYRQYPMDRQLTFGGMHATTAIELVNTLFSGKVPAYWTFDFTDSCLDNEFVEKAADALISGQSPTGLGLNLSKSQISNIDKLAAALQNPLCPTDLQLNLSYNKLNIASLLVLCFALESGKCAKGLELIVKEKDGDVSGGPLFVLLKIASLLKKNEIRHAALDCVVLQQGQKQQKSFIGRVSGDVLQNNLYPFLIPSFFQRREERRKHLVTNIKKTPNNISRLPSFKNCVTT